MLLGHLSSKLLIEAHPALNRYSLFRVQGGFHLIRIVWTVICTWRQEQELTGEESSADKGKKRDRKANFGQENFLAV